MNDTPRKLHILYRHVHVKADVRSRDPNKSRPEWFSHEICFRNLIKTISADPLGHQVTLTVMYDSSLEDLQTDFLAPYIANEQSGVKLQFIKGGSDINSFLITLAYAKAADLPDTDLIYFLENDYLHQDGWVSKVFELYNSGHQFDVVSLYDHKDKYFLQMYQHLTARLCLSASHHWRTTPSTCASFLLAKAAFDRDYDAFSSGKNDFFFFSELIEGRGRVLLSPIPGLSTHSMEGYLSPNVDWAKFAQPTAKGFSI
ncbi:MAG: hypothetical protein Q7U05_07885 [Polaromonas sp.]|nr:hypothetical protein [Polaromonas sp.]